MQSGRDDGNCDALGETDEGLEDAFPLGVWLGDSLGASLGPRDGSCDTLGDSEFSADGLPLGIWLGDTLLGAPLGPRDGSSDTLDQTEGLADGLPLGVIQQQSLTQSISPQSISISI